MNLDRWALGCALAAGLLGCARELSVGDDECSGDKAACNPGPAPYLVPISLPSAHADPARAERALAPTWTIPLEGSAQIVRADGGGLWRIAEGEGSVALRRISLAGELGEPLTILPPRGALPGAVMQASPSILRPHKQGPVASISWVLAPQGKTTCAADASQLDPLADRTDRCVTVDEILVFAEDGSPPLRLDSCPRGVSSCEWVLEAIRSYAGDSLLVLHNGGAYRRKLPGQVVWQRTLNGLPLRPDWSHGDSSSVALFDGRWVSLGSQQVDSATKRFGIFVLSETGEPSAREILGLTDDGPSSPRVLSAPGIGRFVLVGVLAPSTAATGGLAVLAFLGEELMSARLLQGPDSGRLRLDGATIDDTGTVYVAVGSDTSDAIVPLLCRVPVQSQELWLLRQPPEPISCYAIPERAGALEASGDGIVFSQTWKGISRFDFAPVKPGG